MRRIVLFLAARVVIACGPTDLAVLPGSLETVVPEPDHCLMAMPAAQAEWPGWRREVELASEWTGLPLEPRDECENWLDYAPTATDTLSESNWGELRSSFFIVVNSEDYAQGETIIRVVQTDTEPCVVDVWLSSLIARQISFFAGREIPADLPGCEAWPQ